MKLLKLKAVFGYTGRYSHPIDHFYSAFFQLGFVDAGAGCLVSSTAQPEARPLPLALLRWAASFMSFESVSSSSSGLFPSFDAGDLSGCFLVGFGGKGRRS